MIFNEKPKSVKTHDPASLKNYAVASDREKQFHARDNFFVNEGNCLYNPDMTQSRIKYVIGIVAVIAAIGAVVGCKKQPAAAGEQKAGIIELKADSNGVKADNNSPPSSKPASPKPALNDIIRRATSWDTAFTEWYGKNAPDLTVIDINDKKHTLSEYKGKTVMLVFWATWCPPCLAEIPHIIELRKQIGEDKLVILGISYIDQRNTPERIRSFVAANPTINYPVTATNQSTVPRPYNLINSIPCSFFISPDGKIKLATEGLIPLPQMKAIVEAER
jgi:thiol-disulfide isomerase/thioredoxin